MKVLIAILQTVLFYSSLDAAWINRKAEGWAWYEDKIEVEQKLEVESQTKFQTAQEQLAEAKKQLEEKLAEAMIHPTDQNVMCYMVEQKKWLQKASSFARIWEKVLLQNPELDPTATSYPVAQYGIQLQKEIDNEKSRLLISNLSRENGLFFFYEGNSKISQGLSKVIKKFSEKYHWDVVAISVDDTLIEEFVNTRVDNGIAKKIGISVFPALFVINPKEQSATPIAYGFVSLDQIEDNIMLQYKQIDEADNG